MRRHYRFILGPALVLLAAVAVAAEAQVRPAPVREREPRLGVWFGAPEGSFSITRRGRLGITVALTVDAARDTIGARVAGVTPGGPADRAGVRTDDIIVRINGTRLTGADARGHVSSDQSAPGLRLIEMASRLEQGDTVRLDLMRGNRSLSVAIEAGETDADVIIRRFGEGMTGVMPRLGTVFPDAGGNLQIRIGGPLTDLELVRVNPGLAEYFGTSEGLLVVDAPTDSSLGLRAGDVILTIGGRRPTSPAHALRILGTYEAGESVAFEVMRSRRRTTVNGRLPERRSGEWRFFRNSLEMPMLEHLEQMLRPSLELLKESPHLHDLSPMLIREHASPGVMLIRT